MDPNSRHTLALMLSAAALTVSCGGGGGDVPAATAAPSVERRYSMAEVLATGRVLRELPPGEQLSRGGLLDASRDLGPLTVRPAGQDARAHLQVHSSASGATHGVGAQAPGGPPAADQPVGGEANLVQSVAWRKIAADATLELVIGEILVEAIDRNAAPPDLLECPWQWSSGATEPCPQLLAAALELRLSAAAELDPRGPPDYETVLVSVDASVELSGHAGHWQTLPGHDGVPLWTEDDLLVEHDVAGGGSHARVRLKAPLVVRVPLDRVPVGAELVLLTSLRALAFDQRQRESTAGAWLRDPAGGGSVAVRASGLEPAPLRSADAPPSMPDPTPACAGAPRPEAGMLQFERADFVQPELPTRGAAIVITRTGGAAGEVSVGFQTRASGAKAGADFVHVDRRIRFRDGETRRLVHVPVATDGVAELDEVLGLELFDPRGCAVLGAQSSAALTIVDDDGLAPTTRTFSVGGTVSGLAGGTVRIEDRSQRIEFDIAADGAFRVPHDYSANAGYDLRIAAHPEAPIRVCAIDAGVGVVTGDVGGMAVHCEASAAPAGLDPTFGADGRAVGGLPQGAAAIARQADGRIVAGSRSKLARYLADGRVDTSFGSAGIVADVFAGAASDQVADVVVLPDGRIVAVGRVQTDPASADVTDFAAARFLADGSRDTGFGSGGIVRIDFAGGPDEATRVLLQPDGKLVLVGAATTLAPSNGDEMAFGLARLDADGRLDGGFGTGGRATVRIGGFDQARAAVLQPDGGIVIAGRVGDGRADEADTGLARLRADGSLDTGFDGDGRLRLDLSTAWDEAADLLLLPDGRLVVLATAQIGNDMATTLLRLSSDGMPDTGFGSGGRVDLDVGPRGDSPHAAALQADGSMIIALSASGAPVSDFALLRVRADGTPDAGFGDAGVLRVGFFGALGSANDVLVEPDGAIVAAGLVRNAGTLVTALVRVRP